MMTLNQVLKILVGPLLFMFSTFLFQIWRWLSIRGCCCMITTRGQGWVDGGCYQFFLITVLYLLFSHWQLEIREISSTTIIPSGYLDAVDWIGSNGNIGWSMRSWYLEGNHQLELMWSGKEVQKCVEAQRCVDEIWEVGQL